jgi:hypothetical protein
VEFYLLYKAAIKRLPHPAAKDSIILVRCSWYRFWIRMHFAARRWLRNGLRRAALGIRPEKRPRVIRRSGLSKGEPFADFGTLTRVPNMPRPTRRVRSGP